MSFCRKRIITDYLLIFSRFEKKMGHFFQFDSQLRALIFGIIEDIEVYLRTQIAYYTAHKYGTLGYLEESMFSDKHNNTKYLEKIAGCIEENANTLVVKHHKQKYEGKFPLWVIIEFFCTGLRISEFCGLTIGDIDFEQKRISVTHQLQRKRNMEYIIEEPKTSSGIRYIPMSPEVSECFRCIISKRKKPKVEPMIDGKCGFLFLDKNHMPMVALHWEKYFKHILEKYNSLYKVQLPKITPHVCRHTFCSNMARAGMNLKTLQYIMGHSEIGVTLNTYTHMGFEDASAEMLAMEC